MPAPSLRSGSNTVERAALRARVGSFVRRRRQQLGLRLGDISGALGYKSKNAVSNVESGFEGIPAKRAYAWADVLEVPRDVFFQFVIGEIQALDATRASAATRAGSLSTTELALIATYRRLPSTLKAQLRDHARKLEALAVAPQRGRR